MYIGPWAATHGYVPPRRPSSAHPTIVPFQNFEAADGWLVVREAEVLGAALRRDRPSRAERRPALRDDGGSQRAPRRADPGARGRLPEPYRRCLGRGSGRGGGAGLAGELRRGGARRPADGRPRGRGRARASVRSAACGRSGLRSASPRSGQSLERPSVRGPFRGEHTEEVLVGICAYTPERVDELSSAGSSGESGAVSARDLVGYGGAARPSLAPAARVSPSASCSTTRRGASRRRSRRPTPRRRSCTRSSARRRRSAGGT